jgi:hypothetical protein
MAECEIRKKVSIYGFGEQWIGILSIFIDSWNSKPEGWVILIESSEEKGNVNWWYLDILSSHRSCKPAQG